jgi:GT2 family glycosyltransferase
MGEALMEHDFVCCRLEVEKLNPHWARSAHGAPQQYQIPVCVYPPYLPQAGSGTLGIKRALHQQVGGFDESMPVHFDTDYCFKLQLKGAKLHFVPDAVLHIRYRETFSGIYRQAYQWGQYHVFLYKRYRPQGMPKLPWKTGVRAWKDLLVDLLGLENERFPVPTGVLRNQFRLSG